MHAPTLPSAAGGNPHKKIMDPIKLMARRYSMMVIHFGLLLALIFVATFQVRSAILLGINATSAAIFLVYVPRSAYLAWREGRNGIGYGAKVKKKDDKKRAGGETGGMEDWEEGSGERRGWTWDCAGLEVTYLGVQCSTTLVASILCALTLSSDQCYGSPNNTGVFVLDEFANLKERGADHWCRGVIGATIMSFIQFSIDLAWLGWVISVIRVESGIRGGQEAQRLTASAYPHLGREDDGSPTSPSPISPASDGYSAYHPRPHAFHLLQTLLTPTPRLLTALANRRAAAEAESQRLAAAEAAAHRPPAWQEAAPPQMRQIHRPSVVDQHSSQVAMMSHEESPDVGTEIRTSTSLRPEDLEVDVQPHGAEGGEVLPPYVPPPQATHIPARRPPEAGPSAKR